MKTLLISLITALSITTQALALPRVQTFGEVKQQLIEEGWLVTQKKAHWTDNRRTLEHVEKGFSEVTFCAPLTHRYAECGYFFFKPHTKQYVIVKTIPNQQNPISDFFDSETVIHIEVKSL